MKWFLPESGGHAVIPLLQSFLRGDVNLYTPDLLLVETASALWRRAIARQELTVADVRAFYRDLLTLPLNFQPSDRMAASAFSLALMHRHSVYDAVYCALAIEMDCDLVTADRSLVAKLSRTLPFIRHVSELRL